jgi:ectoine hydroxylase-related dioxygenase (phytanoyl-CoA dioxygenase family)
MTETRLLQELERDGLTVVPNALSSSEVSELREELEIAMNEDERIRPDVFDKGMVHNCMMRGPKMASLLDHEMMHAYLSKALSPTCILYAYQSSSLRPSKGNFGSRVHVDSPRFIPGYPTNMGVIFALDPFSDETGGTLYLKGSHKHPDIPDEKHFLANASQATCNAGDMIVFHARVVHAAGVNRTAKTRHALTLNVCRSFMRQRFDYPRLVSSELLSRLGEDGKRFLGMNVRMPTSLDEFYLPEAQRLYKPNQG